VGGAQLVGCLVAARELLYGHSRGKGGNGMGSSNKNKKEKSKNKTSAADCFSCAPLSKEAPPQLVASLQFGLLQAGKKRKKKALQFYLPSSGLHVGTIKWGCY